MPGGDLPPGPVTQIKLCSSPITISMLERAAIESLLTGTLASSELLHFGSKLRHCFLGTAKQHHCLVLKEQLVLDT
ncbi:hypothetical protein KR51_00009030 [Rubidibacter lacunae KORDI 51-2]|uniref:Uncharacterized protein n=1 Tax=Rubidibacter lacunae KORDI 51-2 TaxID=582515 RepID=U5DND6_9CHRO|nr:hypothetical protein KR51_00009030 [Rubidibacter lacunae KORDI 51-2]